MVRVWVPAEGEADGGLHGTVERARAVAAPQAFSGGEQLLALLRAGLDEGEE